MAGRRADEAIELLRERDDASPLARALIDKFIAEAVLGRGAQRAICWMRLWRSRPVRLSRRRRGAT